MRGKVKAKGKGERREEGGERREERGERTRGKREDAQECEFSKVQTYVTWHTHTTHFSLCPELPS